MDSPPARRGQFYSTHLTQRCPNYKLCKVCLMCSNYNKHDALCVACESTKPTQLHHECSQARVEMLVMLEDLYKKPFFDINATPKDACVDLATTSFNMENSAIMNKVMDLSNK